MSRPQRVVVRFLKDTHLPRFTMKKGQKWEKRADRFTDDGFPCGGGFVEKDRYEEAETPRPSGAIGRETWTESTT